MFEDELVRDLPYDDVDDFIVVAVALAGALSVGLFLDNAYGFVLLGMVAVLWPMWFIVVRCLVEARSQERVNAIYNQAYYMALNGEASIAGDYPAGTERGSYNDGFFAGWMERHGR